MKRDMEEEEKERERQKSLLSAKRQVAGERAA